MGKEPRPRYSLGWAQRPIVLCFFAMRQSRPIELQAEQIMTAQLPTLQNDDGTIALTQAPTSSGSRSSSSTGTLAPAPPLSRAQIRGIVVADLALAWTGYGVPVESWRSKLENFRACWNPSLTGLRTPAPSPTETARAAPEPTSIAKPTAFPHSMIQGHTATYVTGTMAQLLGRSQRIR